MTAIATKEPYYTEKRTTIKRGQEKSTVTYDDDLMYQIGSFLRDPRVVPTISRSTDQYQLGRSNSIEPYFGKWKPFFPSGSDNFNYSYHDQTDAYAIASDDDCSDDETEPDLVLFRRGLKAQYTKPPRTLIGSASDNFDVEVGYDTDEQVSRVIPPPLSKTWKTEKPDMLDDHTSFKSSLIEKADLPNNLTNIRSRKLSSTLKVPVLKGLTKSDDMYCSDPIVSGLRDDFDNSVRYDFYL